MAINAIIQDSLLYNMRKNKCVFANLINKRSKAWFSFQINRVNN